MTQPVSPKVLHLTTTLNAVASGTAVTVGFVPQGFRVTKAEVYHGALGTSVTLALGDSGSSTRYIAASAAATAGKLAMTDTLAGGVGYAIPAGGTTVLLTTGGATTTASAITVTVLVTLVEDYA
jgi:hypothetical protein